MLKRLTRTAMSRGFVGGSRAWVVVGTAAIALRVTARVTGKWSWAPYGIVTGGCFVVAGLAVAAATRGGKKKEKRS